MLLTISTTHQPATDLGYLLHKHPAKVQEFSLTCGKATVFYPEISDDRCTAALLVEVDPVAQVRGRNGGKQFGGLDQYVNPRPYLTSSLLCSAVNRVFGTAMSGRCEAKQDLVQQAIPLEITLHAVCARNAEQRFADLFGSLGYEIEISKADDDPLFGEVRTRPKVVLRVTATLSSALKHLYVLLPVVDDSDEKHYFVGDAEVEKLLRHGSGWLATHPKRRRIVKHFLHNKKGLMYAAGAKLKEERAKVEPQGVTIGEALAVLQEPDSTRQHRLEASEEQVKELKDQFLQEFPELQPYFKDSQDPAEPVEPQNSVELVDEQVEAGPTDEGDPDDGTEVEKPTLNALRLQTVREVVRESGAESVLDLGCGEGRFLAEAKGDAQFKRLVGLDTSVYSLHRARKLKKHDGADTDRVSLLAGSFVYRDPRTQGFDAAVCIEVIEHMEPFWLPTFEQNVFGYMAPKTVVVTTPNKEYNVLWDNVGPERFRHKDHRFEWTRTEFALWVLDVAQKYGYNCDIKGVGDSHEEFGEPTQMAVFKKTSPLELLVRVNVGVTE